MSEGWVKLHRKILDNPVLNRSHVYSPFEAFVWLMLKANHKEGQFVTATEVIPVKRGELITSQQKLCKQFRWGSTKLRNFLKLTQKMQMLCVKTTTKTTQISICNYEAYQDSQNENKSIAKRQQHDSNMIATTNKNVKNVKNVKNKINDIDDLFKVVMEEKFIIKYGRDMLEQFVDHWGETPLNGGQMRCQKEKGFSIPRRLATWGKNDYDGHYKLHKEKQNQAKRDKEIDEMTKNKDIDPEGLKKYVSNLANKIGN